MLFLVFSLVVGKNLKIEFVLLQQARFSHAQQGSRKALTAEVWLQSCPDIRFLFQHQVALVVFGSNERVIFRLNDYDTKLEILNAIAAPYFTGGTTNTAGALRAIRTQVFTAENVSARSREHECQHDCVQR